MSAPERRERERANELHKTARLSTNTTRKVRGNVDMEAGAAGGRGGVKTRPINQTAEKTEALRPASPSGAPRHAHPAPSHRNSQRQARHRFAATHTVLGGDDSDNNQNAQRKFMTVTREKRGRLESADSADHSPGLPRRHWPPTEALASHVGTSLPHRHWPPTQALASHIGTSLP